MHRNTRPLSVPQSQRLAQNAGERVSLVLRWVSLTSIFDLKIFICEADAHWHHWILCISTFCNRKKGNASNFVVFHAPRGFLLPVFLFLHTPRNNDSRVPLLGTKKDGAISGTLGESVNPSFSVPRIWSFDLQRAHFCKRVLSRLLLGVAWVTNLIQEHFTSYYI